MRVPKQDQGARQQDMKGQKNHATRCRHARIHSRQRHPNIMRQITPPLQLGLLSESDTMLSNLFGSSWVWAMGSWHVLNFMIFPFRSLWAKIRAAAVLRSSCGLPSLGMMKSFDARLVKYDMTHGYHEKTILHRHNAGRSAPKPHPLQLLFFSCNAVSLFKQILISNLEPTLYQGNPEDKQQTSIIDDYREYMSTWFWNMLDIWASNSLLDLLLFEPPILNKYKRHSSGIVIIIIITIITIIITCQWLNMGNISNHQLKLEHFGNMTQANKSHSHGDLHNVGPTIDKLITPKAVLGLIIYLSFSNSTWLWKRDKKGPFLDDSPFKHVIFHSYVRITRGHSSYFYG